MHGVWTFSFFACDITKSNVEYMHDSLEGLRSIIGKNLMDDRDPFCGSFVVEHCKNPDQFGRGSSVEDKNQLVCHMRSQVDIVIS